MHTVNVTTRLSY